MKWLIIPAIATSFVSLHLTKHITIQHGTGQGHVDAAQVAKALNLSKDQKNQVKEVRFQLLRQFINAHMQGREITQDDHKKMAGEASAQIQRILTAEQFNALSNQGGAVSLLDMMTAHMELFARLNVTKEQGVKLHDLMAGLHKDMQGTHEQQTHEQMRTKLDETFSRIHDILTPAQLQRLHELLETGKA